MEDRWHGPEEPTDQEQETTRKKRRGTDFLSQYLLRRREQQGEHIEEDDDQESEEKPKKKFRNFFKGLFKNVVEPPEGDDEKQSKRFSLENLFLQPENSSEESTDNTLQEVESHQPETFTPIETPDTASGTEQTRQFPDNQPVMQGSVSDERHNTPGQEHPELPQKDVPQAPEQPIFERQYMAPPIVERPNPLDRTVFERQQTQPVEKEVVIERGAGMALPVVLVGAEYLARKRADRKIDAKYDEKVTRLETNQNREVSNREQLETLVKQNKEQLESLKRERGIATSSPEKRLTPERKEPRELKYEQQPITHSSVEKVSQKGPEKAVQQETYKIMEQVAEAAEHDIPVERVFERSHEVKDDQTIPVGAMSVGSIMADRVAQQQNEQSAKNQISTTPSSLPIVTESPQPSATYKRAIQSGFWAAIIIIIIGIMAYLLK